LFELIAAAEADGSDFKPGLESIRRAPRLGTPTLSNLQLTLIQQLPVLPLKSEMRLGWNTAIRSYSTQLGIIRN
jgi:hypothetical protein